jgi:hypothetical protein
MLLDPSHRASAVHTRDPLGSASATGTQKPVTSVLHVLKSETGYLCFTRSEVFFSVRFRYAHTHFYINAHAC